METLEQKKANLRKEIKKNLKSMEPNEKAALDHTVCERLFTMPEVAEATMIYGYMSLSWETGTEEILNRLWKQGTRVALPKVIGDRMDFFEVRSMEDLAEGTFHILEPKNSCEKVCWPTVHVLVPGIAFDPKGRRLGKGGGYYDKFFAEEPDHGTIALAYEFQIADELPAEEHDQPVEHIVTEKRII